MAESNKQYMGDGHDNIGQAAHKTAEAAKQVSKAIAGKAASAGAQCNQRGSWRSSGRCGPDWAGGCWCSCRVRPQAVP